MAMAGRVYSRRAAHAGLAGGRDARRPVPLRPSARRRHPEEEDRSGTGRRASRPPASPACAARREYTRPAMAITDRYGLPVTTPSAVAAARFQDGMDRLLSYDAGAEESFAAAVRADERLAVAHAGIALVAVAHGDAATARAAAERARHSVAGAP